MRSLVRGVLALAAMATVLPAEAAQHDPAHHPSTGAQTPYSGLEKREIKALSAEETERLLTGQGMGLALAAELNHYPGPKHVLELAGKLELSDEQAARIEALREAMSVEAIRLGGLIVERERELDRSFAARRISVHELQHRTETIGRLQGELRAAHLAAHIEVRALLSEHQGDLYDQLRGYATKAGPTGRDSRRP